MNTKKDKIFENGNINKFITTLLVIVLGISWYFLLLRFDRLSSQLDKIIRSIRPIVYGIVLAYLLNPIMMFCRRVLVKKIDRWNISVDRKNKIAKAGSIMIAIFIGILMLVILAMMILPELYRTIMEMIKVLPDQLKKYMQVVEELLNDKEAWNESVMPMLEKAALTLEGWLNNGLIDKVNNVISYITKSIINVLWVGVDLTIGIIVAVYALMEKERSMCQLKKIIYAIFNSHKANLIIDTVRHGHKIFSAFLIGKIIDSVIVGLITYPVLLIIDTPYALLITVIIAVTNIIPYFGPFIGGIPSTILIFLISPRKSLYFVIFIIILQQIDGNIIEPKILKNTTNISEFWVTFALLLAGGLWGFVGMVIGVPLFAVIYYILKKIIDSRLSKKNLPVESNSYMKVKGINEEDNTLIM